MTKKITISVSDELHEKMMEWKDSFNFSQVFQNAISGLIQKKEDFQKRLKGDENMTAIIERLKKEKGESEHEWFEIGKDKGLQWAKLAHWDELMLIIDMEGNEIPIEKLTEIESANEDWFDDEVFNLYPLFKGTKAYGIFEAGFIDGVVEFYDEIKDKI